MQKRWRSLLEGQSTELDPSGRRIFRKAPSQNSELAKIWRRESAKKHGIFRGDSETSRLPKGTSETNFKMPQFSKDELRSIRGNSRNSITNEYSQEIARSAEPLAESIRWETSLSKNVLKNLTNVGRVSGALGGTLAGAALTGLAIQPFDLQPEVAEMVQAAGGGAVAEGFITRAHGLKHLARLRSMLHGAGAGVAGAFAGQETVKVMNDLLRDSGLDEGAQSVIAETMGGISSGAVGTLAVPYFAAGTGAVANAALDLAGMSAAFNTSVRLGMVGGWAGVAVGAAIGAAISGGIALSSALQERRAYILQPYSVKHADEIIGRDLVSKVYSETSMKRRTTRTRRKTPSPL